MRISHLQMGCPASACWVGPPTSSHLETLRRAGLCALFKKIHRCFHFLCPFVFNTPYIYHSSRVRRFFCHVESLDAVPSSPSSSDWFKIYLSAPFPAESLQGASEKDSILTTLRILTGYCSGWERLVFFPLCMYWYEASPSHKQSAHTLKSINVSK